MRRCRTNGHRITIGSLWKRPHGCYISDWVNSKTSNSCKRYVLIALRPYGFKQIEKRQLETVVRLHLVPFTETRMNSAVIDIGIR